MGYGRQEPVGNSSDFTSNFLGARLALENTVCDLICSGWDEDRRRRAYDMAVALTQAAKLAGWWESESLLRRLSSLLDLSLPQVTSIRQEVRDKLIEILNLLKKHSASRSA